MPDNTYTVKLEDGTSWDVNSPSPLTDEQAYQAAKALRGTVKPKPLTVAERQQKVAEGARRRGIIPAPPGQPTIGGVAISDLQRMRQLNASDAEVPVPAEVDPNQRVREAAYHASGDQAAYKPKANLFDKALDVSHNFIESQKKADDARRARGEGHGPKALQDLGAGVTDFLYGAIDPKNIVESPGQMIGEAITPGHLGPMVKQNFADYSSVRAGTRSVLNTIAAVFPFLNHGAGVVGEGIADDFAKGFNQPDDFFGKIPELKEKIEAVPPDSPGYDKATAALAAIDQLKPEPVKPVQSNPHLEGAIGKGDIAATPETRGPSKTVVAKAADSITPTQTASTLGPSHTEVVEPPAEPTPKTEPPEEPVPSATTQGKNAATARDRAHIGLDDLPDAERKTFQTTLDNAKEKGLNSPDYADRLAGEVNGKPRPLNDEETAGLVLRLGDLKQQHATAINALEHAIDAGKMDQAARFKLELDQIETAHDTVTKALKVSGTEAGRSLASRKLAINTDYDLVSVLQRAKNAKIENAKSPTLTDAERTKFEDQAKLIDNLQKQLEDARTGGRIKPSEGGAKAPKGVLDRITESNKVFTADKVRAALKDLLGAPLGSGAEGVAAIGKALYHVAGAFVEAGYRSFPRFMAALRQAHPDVAAKADIEAWKEAHDNAKSDLDKANPPEKRPLPEAEQAVIAELNAAKADRAKALGAVTADERAKANTERVVQQWKAEQMAKDDAKVRNQRRKEIRQAFSEEDRAQKKAQADYDTEYRQRAKDAGVLQHTTETLDEINKYGADAKDLEHQGAMEHFVGDLLDKGATPKDVVDAVEKRLPNADPYERALLMQKAVGAYRSRFKMGRSVPENYLERGSAALMGDDASKLRAELDLAKRTVDAEVGKLRPEPGYKKLDKFFTSNALASVTNRLYDIAANTVSLAGFLVTHPIKVPVSAILDHFVLHSAGFGVERALTPSRLMRIISGAKERLSIEARDTIRGTDPDTLAKFGQSTIITKATGLTDVPFKEFYTQFRLDDLATTMAKHLESTKGKRAAMRDTILKQFRDPEAKGPLTPQEVQDGIAIAHDYSLRMTFNVDNVASSIIHGGESGVMRLGKKYGPAGENAAGYATVLLKPLTRFSRVIGNVALDRANFAHPTLSLGEAVGRIVNSKITKTPFSPSQAEIITRLASKGLVGVALVQMGRYLVANKTFQPKLVTTTGGKRYYDYGDLDQFGGPISAILYGASLEDADRQDLTDQQRQQLLWETNVSILGNQPIVSGPQRAFQAMENSKSAGKFAGTVAANTIIPSFIRDWARRQDSYKNNGSLFDARNVKADTFTDQFKKNIPFVRDQMADAGTDPSLTIPARRKGESLPLYKVKVQALQSLFKTDSYLKASAAGRKAQRHAIYQEIKK